MRVVVLRAATVIGVLTIVAAISVWLLRSPANDVIPAEFRGIWLDAGAECQDIGAQVRITGSTISYDGLSFKADGVAEKRVDAVSLTGSSFPKGDAERATVQLQMQDNRTKLIIVARDLREKGAFVRCPSDQE